MTQQLNSICGVIKLLRVVYNTSANLVPPIHCGLLRTLHSSAEMNARELKAALIDDKNSSSTTVWDYMYYKSRFGLESEYCDRLELNGSGLLTSNSLEFGPQVSSGDVRLNQGREITSASVGVCSLM